ncbi:cytochrome c oxidase subunit 4, partial [Arthrobacter deserti]|nr:cytochrome c oxidase subunit 4 [Arthrobacter deserti]
GMIGFYLLFTGRRVGPRPEDRLDAEIHEGAGEQGHFSPWSWWPIVLSAAAATGFLGLASGWWIFYIGVGFSIIAIIGWVYEYSRGLHAH